AGGGEILQALTQMREMTGSVQGGSGEMKSGNDQMLTAMRNVSEITLRSRDAMDTIIASVEQISAAIGDISSVSDVNHSQIEEILRATGELKLASRDTLAPGNTPTSEEASPD
ncbi:hypothetical protein SAMN05920897_1111, partial [Alkalispirochaeta americana]